MMTMMYSLPYILKSNFQIGKATAELAVTPHDRHSDQGKIKNVQDEEGLFGQFLNQFTIRY